MLAKDSANRQTYDADGTIPNVSKENLEAYYRCMQTEAIYLSAIPSAIVAAGLPFVMTSIFNLRPLGTGPTLVLGLTGYLFGRARYSFKCLEKYAPDMLQVLQQKRYPHMQRPLEPQNPLSEAKNQEPEWSNYNTSSDDNDIQLGTSDNYEKDDTSKPTDHKSGLTYDDLRKQSRSQYKSSVNQYIPQTRPRFVPQPKIKRDEELLEDTTSGSDTKGETIWA